MARAQLKKNMENSLIRKRHEGLKKRRELYMEDNEEFFQQVIFISIFSKIYLLWKTIIFLIIFSFFMQHSIVQFLLFQDESEIDPEDEEEIEYFSSGSEDENGEKRKKKSK